VTEKDAAQASTASKERLVLLANASMRARRRPLAILCVWLAQLALGLAYAWPAAGFARQTYGSSPSGDAALFEGGGLALSDLLRHEVLQPAAAAAFVVMVAGMVLGLLPLGALLASIAHTTPARSAPPMRRAAQRAVEAFGPLFALLLLGVGLQVSLAAVAIGSGQKVAAARALVAGDRNADELGIALSLMLLVPVALTGVVHDLARAAVVRYRIGAFDALRIGLKTFAASPVGLAWSWGWRALVALVPVIAATAVATRLGGRGGGVLAALFGVHQAVLLARGALRASWLARALRAVDARYKVVRVVEARAADGSH
jgi:hypothetical protein